MGTLQVSCTGARKAASPTGNFNLHLRHLCPERAAFHMVLLRLTLLLMPVPCLLQTNQISNPPIKNLRMEPKTQMLTWDVDGNVTGIQCVKGADYEIEAMNNRYCQFAAISLCEVTNYTVVVASPPFSASILFPEDGGNSQAAAQNLTCWVHEVDLMSCSWAVGPEAPGDTQYHLSVNHPESQEQHPCVHYNTNERGTHIGCVFSDVSAISSGSPTAFILVRGSSEAFRVPCVDQHVVFSEIEILTPPNLTAKCNKTHSFMDWEMRSHFNPNFHYELQIQKVNSHPAWTSLISEQAACNHRTGQRHDLIPAAQSWNIHSENKSPGDLRSILDCLEQPPALRVRSGGGPAHPSLADVTAHRAGDAAGLDLCCPALQKVPCDGETVSPHPSHERPHG
ncbi:interleukin-3 receptor subunit alpha isoform X2 [Callithrix jacchus]|uniref:interleukin-3 receptor subunit alpha isoform X2 n=1 Tax=Callithrix jacchus TaxID=9483 RepID=UPI0023DD2FF4|nr:interleukin-3 receptor subunit alpha isoform X2 [Callithrix jacchus]XP_054107614.1 interleukin-3 receptor subunit alpha isoform X2 [Callithrix jacchus]